MPLFGKSGRKRAGETYSVWHSAGGSSTGTWQWKPWEWGPWRPARSPRSGTTCHCSWQDWLQAQRFLPLLRSLEGYSGLWRDTQKLQEHVSLVEISRKTWRRSEYRLCEMVYSLEAVSLRTQASLFTLITQMIWPPMSHKEGSKVSISDVPKF